MLKYVFVLLLTLAASPAAAQCVVTDNNPCTGLSIVTSYAQAGKAAHHAAGLGRRPALWCGWEMRRKTGHYDIRLNRAREWLNLFPRVTRAAATSGDAVVWARGRKGGGHVGQIVRLTGPCTAQVYSGNNGHGAGVQERNICNAIGFARL